MTLREIDDQLPNGFHDAEIEQIYWDCPRSEITLHIEFWVATEDSDRERRRRGSVKLQGLEFFVIDPPEPRQLDAKRLSGGRLSIDGIATNGEVFPGLSNVKPLLPPDVEPFSFYVSNWNSFIHVACADASLTWKETE